MTLSVAVTAPAITLTGAELSPAITAPAISQPGRALSPAMENRIALADRALSPSIRADEIALVPVLIFPQIIMVS